MCQVIDRHARVCDARGRKQSPTCCQTATWVGLFFTAVCLFDKGRVYLFMLPVAYFFLIISTIRDVLNVEVYK